jgi:hypothetical protein
MPCGARPSHSPLVSMAITVVANRRFILVRPNLHPETVHPRSRDSSPNSCAGIGNEPSRSLPKSSSIARDAGHCEVEGKPRRK